MKIKDVVELLGEPEVKSGGRTIPVGIVYQKKGVQLDFQRSTWDDGDNPIACLTYFKPDA